MKPRPQRRINLFDLGQVKLPHLRLIGNRQRFDTTLAPIPPCSRLPRRSRSPPESHPHRERESCDSSATFRYFTIRSLAKTRSMAAFSSPNSARFTTLIVACSKLIAFKLWSGRRESNPRPTAWKAVTLPLSYSRPNQLSALSCQLSVKTFAPYTQILEPMIRIELMTSPLPRECSTN